MILIWIMKSWILDKMYLRILEFRFFRLNVIIYDEGLIYEMILVYFRLFFIML